MKIIMALILTWVILLRKSNVPCPHTGRMSTTYPSLQMLIQGKTVYKLFIIVHVATTVTEKVLIYM